MKIEDTGREDCRHECDRKENQGHHGDGLHGICVLFVDAVVEHSGKTLQ